MTPPRAGIFFVRRERWTLTWTGWFLTLALVATFAFVATRGLYDFLSISDPVRAPYLVVEGWMPTYVYREAVDTFHNGGYEKIIAVGVMIKDGDSRVDQREDFGSKVLMRLGIRGDQIVTASYDAIQRDRTFHAALAVSAWLESQGIRTTSIDVLTVGPHARRTRLLYQEALGDDVRVGIISVNDRLIDPRRWWGTSEGARSVITEAIGYIYARLFFTPELPLAPRGPGGGK